MTDATPYGAWPSPLDARDVAAGTLEFGGVAVDGGDVYWLERRPSEGGRGVVLRCGPGADGVGEAPEAHAVTPADVDVRTTVHEYGGGDFAVRDGTVVYSRFDDGRLYAVDADAGGHPATARDAEPDQEPGPDREPDPTPLTPDPPEPSADRYADVEFAPDADRLYCVRERHHGPGTDEEPVNELVALPRSGGEPTAVAAGHDFYSFPRLSPDGDRLAWTTWDHPRMPWDGTELHVATVEPDGTLTDESTVLGGPEESVFQPTWGPDGTLYAVSDRTGWWNLYRVTPDGPTVLREEAAEYGTPQWAFGLATYVPLDDGRLVAVRNSDGRQELGILDPTSGDFAPAGLPYAAYPHPRLATDGETVACIAAGPGTPQSVVRWRPAPATGPDGTGEDGAVALRRAFDLDLDPDYVPDPDHRSYPTGEDGAETAHALVYPPRNPAVRAPDGPPPLVVEVHGGPTAQTLPVADPEILYFTTRGFAVADVNYRGSTGYGRAYRERLAGAWGEVDTEDCVAAARSLADAGEADPERLAIRGGSAGGYAALCALAFHDAFDAGTSYYGVGDLRALAAETHKFESRYLDGLVGPLPEAAATYEARSPVAHAGDISAPLLVLQGGEDRVVPQDQAEDLVAALVDSGTPYAYLLFPDERHGFRTATAREAALAAELGFYAAVFGFEPADDLAGLELRRGEYHRRTVGGEDG